MKLLLWILLSTSSAAQSDLDMSARIRALMGQRHPELADKQILQWNQLGPPAQTVEALTAMIAQTKSSMDRARLLEALAFFDTPEAYDALKKEIDAANASDTGIVRRLGLRALGAQLSRTHSPGGAEFLEKYLDHEDPQTRLSSAIALSHVDPSRTERFRKDSKNPPWMLQALEASGTLTPSIKAASPIVKKTAPTLQDPSKRFVGIWQGQWISIGTDKAASARAATFTLDKLFNGNLTLADEVWKFSGTVNEKTNEGRLESESLRGTLTQSPTAKGTHGCKAEVTLWPSQVEVLELRCPTSSGFFVGRK